MNTEKINEYFRTTVEGIINGTVSRSEAASSVVENIGIDEISGGNEKLLVQCEWALRHANEPDYYTSGNEFKYLLSCLKNEQRYAPENRDKAILDILILKTLSFNFEVRYFIKKTVGRGYILEIT